jgi:predicted metalloendopeptidase
VRQSYLDYLTQLFTLAGLPDPAGAAPRVIALETAIARKQWERARNRDRNAIYNPRTVVQLGEAMPSFDWKAYPRRGRTRRGHERHRQPARLPRRVDSILKATPVATWREYFAAKLLDTYSPELSSPFVQARFDFRGKVLNGQQEQRGRWKRGVTEVELGLGDAAGKLYVARHFKPEAKARMDSLIRNLREAYSIGIDSLEWMTPATKARAKDKLAKFTVKIGYPERWRDYSSLEVRRDDLVGNVMRARQWAYADMLARYGKPVDKVRWLMTPQTVNAYYNSTNNEIVFPAGDPPAAVLRSHRGRRGELRRDRRDHRPRDRPRLRRPGAQVGRRRQPDRLVDPRRREGVRGAREQARAHSSRCSRRSRGPR